MGDSLAELLGSPPSFAKREATREFAAPFLLLKFHAGLLMFHAGLLMFHEGLLMFHEGLFCSFCSAKFHAAKTRVSRAYRLAGIAGPRNAQAPRAFSSRLSAVREG